MDSLTAFRQMTIQRWIPFSVLLAVVVGASSPVFGSAQHSSFIGIPDVVLEEARSSASEWGCAGALGGESAVSGGEVGDLRRNRGRRVKLMLNSGDVFTGFLQDVSVAEAATAGDAGITLAIGTRRGIRRTSMRDVFWYTFDLDQVSVFDPDWIPTPGDGASSQTQVKEHNTIMREFNVRRVNHLLGTPEKPGPLALMKPQGAIPRIFGEMTQGHVFEGKDSEFEAFARDKLPASVQSRMKEDVHIKLEALRGFQHQLRRMILRQDRNSFVFYRNMLPPAPSDLHEIMQEFYVKLESLIQQSVARPGRPLVEQALVTAAWALHMIAELQPGFDLNTRVGQQAFNYVLSRFNHVHGLRFPSIDFSLPAVRHAKIDYVVENGGVRQSRQISPFSDDLKKYLNEVRLQELREYSEANGRMYLIAINDRVLGPYMLVIDQNKKPITKLSAEYADHVRTGYETQRDFVSQRIRATDLDSLVRDPVFSAEADWLSHWMLEALRRPAHASRSRI